MSELDRCLAAFYRREFIRSSDEAMRSLGLSRRDHPDRFVRFKNIVAAAARELGLHRYLGDDYYVKFVRFVPLRVETDE